MTDGFQVIANVLSKKKTTIEVSQGRHIITEV